MSADALLRGALRPQPADWPGGASGFPAGVKALMSGRAGGVSVGAFASLNLRPACLTPHGAADADDPAAVQENQRRFAAALGVQPVWLRQVHGTALLRLDAAAAGAAALVEPAPDAPTLPVADASLSTDPGLACAVLVADCLPVLFCSPDGRAVAAAHAGWRGLAGGVLEATLAALCEASGCDPREVWVWLGACIGPTAFEVGADVLLALGADPASADPALFAWSPRADGSPRWRAHLPRLATERLRRAGVRHIGGGHWCTFSDRSRFFSFRRDGVASGRMAAAIACRG